MRIDKGASCTGGWFKQRTLIFFLKKIWKFHCPVTRTPPSLVSSRICVSVCGEEQQQQGEEKKN